MYFSSSCESCWFSISLFGHSDMLYSWLRWRYPNANDFGSEIIPASAKEYNVQVCHSFHSKIGSHQYDKLEVVHTNFRMLSALWLGISYRLLFWFSRPTCSTITGKTLEPSSPSLMQTWLSQHSHRILTFMMLQSLLLHHLVTFHQPR
jgi:hypothetical protein